MLIGMISQQGDIIPSGDIIPKLDRRYHCFGCGADGDVIDFAAALCGLAKKEAAVQLANDRITSI